MNGRLIQRAARIEYYRRDFLKYCAEQVTILPKVGAPQRLSPLLDLQMPIEAAAARQWRERGFIRIVVFKARQRGGTTYSIARATWRAYLNPNISGIVISCDDDSTANAFNKAQLIYDEMTPDVRPVRRFLNRQQIVLENADAKTRGAAPGLRSRIEVQTAKNMNAAVSTTRQVAALSEMPRWSRTEEIRSSLIPTMPLDAPGTIVINEATPFGWGAGKEEFRQWCDAARSGKDVYELVELYWWMDTSCRIARQKGERIRYTLEENYWRKKCSLDDEQILFRRRMIAELGKTDQAVGEMLFLQEFPGDYDSAWVAAETPAFDRVQVEKLTKATVKSPIRKCEIDLDALEVVNSPDGQGALWIWEEPRPGELYDMAADCASGRSGDFCAFQIIKRRTKEQVAEYCGHPGVYDYAAMLQIVGGYYNDAHLAIEVNGIGYAVNEAVTQSGYGNVYRWRLRQQAAPKFSPLTGWKTQDDTKKLMLAVMYRLMDSGELIVRSERLRDEMRHYIKYYSEAGNEKYEAGEGHDDLLSAFMIAQVVSRDEDALGAPPQGGYSHSGRLLTLAERNDAIVQFMRTMQPGMSERGASMMYQRVREDDPWDRLARNFGQRNDDD